MIQARPSTRGLAAVLVRNVTESATPVSFLGSEMTLETYFTSNQKNLVWFSFGMTMIDLVVIVFCASIASPKSLQMILSA